MRDLTSQMVTALIVLLMTTLTVSGADGLIQLTSEGGHTARWSPDGSRIVFTSIRDTGNHEIYRMNSDGTDQTRLTYHSSYDKLASWHPDGTQIVFVSTRYGGHDIYTMNIDGSGVTRIIDHPSWDDGPSWSQDASKLLFESGRDGDWEVYTIDADMTNLTQLTHNSVIDGNGSWSYTGDMICFTSYRTGNPQIHVMEADGSNQVNVSDNSYVDDWATWSPDGRIVFTSNRDGNKEIYIMDADGSNQTRLTDNPAADLLPQISPDGQWLLFHSDRGGIRNVYKMQMPGTEVLVVALDIKPGSCPNPLNTRVGNGHTLASNPDVERMQFAKARPDAPRKNGPVLPGAILGTTDFDVNDIVASTIALEGVSVLRWDFEDVATPVGADAGECECNDYGPDGFMDLALKFSKAQIVQALGEVYDGDVIPLTITGELADGTQFEGTDCVVIIGGSEAAAFVSSPLGLTNYPNPFNPVTDISYSLPTASQVKLTVYNIMGQEVATLVDEHKTAGTHVVSWRGVTDSGQPAASGVYFYRLEAADFSETKKMLLLK